jgi:hypothetical protein
MTGHVEHRHARVGVMVHFSNDAVFLTGVTLAHAFRIVVTSNVVNPLPPCAFFHREGQRQYVVFEAETYAQAIVRAREAMSEATAASQTWTFASERVWRYVEPTEDVVVVEFWGVGMESPATVLQPFGRATEEEPFRLLGPTLFLVGGHVVQKEVARATLVVLEEGIRSDEIAAECWRGLRSS